ncbi:MAG TPA: serine/threonine-protein kinase, partial [Pyrinomonadaceae bacterium]|nr:serine/threonine-protein kinase [Pyrinomonadaceae bacterium]
MAYCYECGEKVAENDVFCPYCGISLHPIAVAGADEDDDSFSKTIVSQQPIAVPVPSPSLPESAFVNEISPSLKSDELHLKERLAGDISDQQIDYSKEDTSENLILRDEDFNNQSDIPIPKILEPLKPIADTSCDKASSSNNENMQPTVQKADVSETNDTGNANLEPVFTSTGGEQSDNQPVDYSAVDETEFASQNESSLMSYEEAEVKEVLSAEEPDKSVDEEISRIEEARVSQPNRINLGVINIKEESREAEAEHASSSTENAPVAEQPIVMPQAELPVAEHCPPSRFDSVSIMEKSESVEESTPNIAARNSFSNDLEAASLSASKISEEKGNYTTPNIAGSDTDGKGKAKLKPLDEGTVLNGRYEIIRKIGGGGMGAVYLASDKNLGGVLRAVKEMVQSYIEDAQQEKAVNDFKRESLLLTSLDHQSIPTIYDYFFDEKEARFYLVMKYISGGDLAGRLRSAPESRIDENSVTNWAVQIADVLDYLHNRQPPIVYRDLKPANVMVDGNSGRVMLIDFGIAR